MEAVVGSGSEWGFRRHVEVKVMATQPPEATVPQWFHAYALENERQHRELATQIAAIRGELTTAIANVENRLIKWIVAQFFAATVAASSIALLVQQLFGD